jgi:hypothetical protein
MMAERPDWMKAGWFPARGLEDAALGGGLLAGFW